MSNFAFFVGIDWADKKHDIAVVNDQGKMESLKVIEHSIEAVEALLSDLLFRAQGRPIAIMLEQSRGALINVLVLRENVFLFPSTQAIGGLSRELSEHESEERQARRNVAGSPVIRTSQRDDPLEA